MSEIQFGMLRAEVNFPCRITCTDSREEARSLYALNCTGNARTFPKSRCSRFRGKSRFWIFNISGTASATLTGR